MINYIYPLKDFKLVKSKIFMFGDKQLKISNFNDNLHLPFIWYLASKRQNF